MSSDITLAAEENSELANKLASEFKKKGFFDELRRKLLKDFQDSDTNKDLHRKIEKIVDNQVKKDPTLLSRGRGRAAALLDGTVSRDTDIQDPILKYVHNKTVESNELSQSVEESLRRIMEDLPT
ncbi:hypothetical protein NADFUDRAFT_44502 [Nadsonia fulvescens var. elongata DSM 6958]|uniref:BOD1/SHG1 domain-containing protein n=1 Tax=Nadsonia fulvescens var. elongata DSM 6958 TaxID=857566 RepID=A0A1E3PSF1_9ASCO|nr:hypothetical protein NADFUDRAFT_44502 [Nadsonia fulvescens var. elongata DSM 6958]